MSSHHKSSLHLLCQRRLGVVPPASLLLWEIPHVTHGIQGCSTSPSPASPSDCIFPLGVAFSCQIAALLQWCWELPCRIFLCPSSLSTLDRFHVQFQCRHWFSPLEQEVMFLHKQSPLNWKNLQVQWPGTKCSKLVGCHNQKSQIHNWISVCKQMCQHHNW